MQIREKSCPEVQEGKSYSSNLKNISLPRWCLEHELSKSLLRLYCQGYVFFIPFNIPYAGHIIHFFVFLFPFILFVCSIHDLSPSGGNLIIGSILLVFFFYYNKRFQYKTLQVIQFSSVRKEAGCIQ